ncbi:tyrosine-type recombinase/integrase [Dokdonella sp.]|uniref:tyrosine-type recombinase/integrase n=1 Tax=Dokdonella sp. TaxID=2291710 RepID=UPI003F7E2F3F
MFDSGGLHLEVTPSGAKYWRWKFRFAGKEKRLALGVFPEISLAAARRARDIARTTLQGGADPSAIRRTERVKQRTQGADTFGAIKSEWMDRQRHKLAAITLAKAEWVLGLVSSLDARPMTDITPPEVLAVLRRIESRGHHETAHRARSRIGQVFRYAIVTGRAERDPTPDLKGALAPVVTTSHAAVTDPKEVAALLRAIDGYEGQPMTAVALRLSPMLFVRPGNLRAMEWEELDLDAAEWRIPPDKMKMREAHIVPLPKQAVALLRDLRKLTGSFRYVFPSLRSPKRPMSANTINAALRRLGFDGDTMTAHGFRAMASTRLNELGWSPDVIERQLAHVEQNKVRAVYNRAQYLAERRKMMQAWANYLEALRSDAPVVPLRRRSPAA